MWAQVQTRKSVDDRIECDPLLQLDRLRVKARESLEHGLGSDLLQEARLADAGLTTHEEKVEASTPDALENLPRFSQLGCPANERHVGDGRPIRYHFAAQRPNTCHEFNESLRWLHARRQRGQVICVRRVGRRGPSRARAGLDHLFERRYIIRGNQV